MIRNIVLGTLLLCSTSVFAQQKSSSEVMTKSKGTYTINTTTLCNKVGFKGTTPLIVTVKKDKIVEVKALPNHESPNYFNQVKKVMLKAYEGMKFEKYNKVDCVTGATMSSKAVQANMAEALKYYKKNK